MNSELMGKLRKSSNQQRIRILAVLAQLSDSLDNNNDDLNTLDTTTLDTLQASCNHSVTNWKKSFSPSRSMIPSISDNNRNHRFHVNQPQKRLMSTFEKVMKPYKKRQVIKSAPKCGFCSESGHKVTNCPKRESLCSYTMQYILCNDHSCKENCDNLIRSLKEGPKTGTRFDLGADHLDSRCASKNLIIRKAYYLDTLDDLYAKQFDRMIFDIVYIDKMGNPEEIDNPIKVQGEGLRTALKFSATQTKKRYVFDMTKGTKRIIEQEVVEARSDNPMKEMKFELQKTTDDTELESLSL